jgi:hypothetical protein
MPNPSFSTRLKHARSEITTITDALGMPVDKGIRDTVITFWLMGFQTEGSCEGHLERGCASPWVDIIAASPPAHRWKGQKSAEKAILARIGATKAQISSGHGFDQAVWRRFKNEESAWLKTQSHIESPAFTTFIHRCLKVRLSLSGLVEDFNHAFATPTRKIALDFFPASGHTRITVLDEWVLEDNAANRTKAKPTTQRKARLLARQKLMKKFTRVLLAKAKKSL